MKKSSLSVLIVIVAIIGYALGTLQPHSYFIGERFETIGSDIYVSNDGYNMPDGTITVYGVPNGTYANGSNRYNHHMFHSVTNLGRFTDTIKQISDINRGITDPNLAKRFQISVRIHNRGYQTESVTITNIKPI